MHASVSSLFWLLFFFLFKKKEDMCLLPMAGFLKHHAVEIPLL